MRNLIEIFNDNDLRWLLDVSEIPEKYDTEYLVPVLDEIIFEYEDLRGDKFYTNFLRTSDFATKDAAKLVILRGCYTLYETDKLFIHNECKEAADALLKQIKVSADSMEKVDFEMKRVTQQLQVKAMKDAKKKKEKTNYGELCANISKHLGVSIKDVRESTVAEFVGYEKMIKKDKSNG